MTQSGPGVSLTTIRRQVVACQECARLRAYCARVAEDKRAAFQEDVYWGRPVPGFGDPQARLLVLGLAPAAHGANRTGRVFTGDRSGDFLIRAMHEAGLANQPTSQHARDGLKLRNAYLTAAVRCAPPENKPTVTELANCFRFLDRELSALPNVRVIVALGKIAFEAYWRLLEARDITPPRPRPRFAHGYTFETDLAPTLVACYHPSQQNTNTGRLTSRMIAEVFAKAVRLAGKA